MDWSKSIWLASSRAGQLRVFTSPPDRDERLGVWLGQSMGCVSSLLMLMESEGMRLPEMKWTDEPVKIMIRLSDK